MNDLQTPLISKRAKLLKKHSYIRKNICTRVTAVIILEVNKELITDFESTEIQQNKGKENWLWLPDRKLLSEAQKILRVACETPDTNRKVTSANR